MANLFSGIRGFEGGIAGVASGRFEGEHGNSAVTIAGDNADLLIMEQKLDRSGL